MPNNQTNIDVRIGGHPVELSSDYACDVLTAAVEGGSNYWARFESVERDSDLNVHRVQFTVPGGVHEGDEATVYTVRATDVQNAVRRLLDPALKLVHGRIRQTILEDNNDAESSDCILQVAAFGEVIFG